MIKLEPRTIQEFRCSFCSRKYRVEYGCKNHEYKCYKNPERHCPTCGDTGTEFFDALGPELGVIPDADSRDCESCKIAEMLGGKSYIEHDN